MTSTNTVNRAIDPKFKYEVSKLTGAEKILLCFQCGTCTAGCPIARFSEFYKPRRIARLVQLGFKNKLLTDNHLWLCATCYECTDHCPQDVDPANVVRALQNLAIKETENVPSVSQQLAITLLKQGYVYTIPASRLKRRDEKGLPPLPPVNLQDIAKMFDSIGVTKLLEYSKTFEKVDG